MMMLNCDATAMVAPMDEQRWALDLFKQTTVSGGLRRLWGALRGRRVALRSLGAAGRHGGHDLGHQTVAIDEIVGSEGRAGDFDSRFAPLSERTRDRWVSVAQARNRGRALPAVLLIRAEDGYYVRDGHHRISVARALGEEFVEAEVISWE
ncbi:MAG: hypothetical protein HGA45_25300 [Chloroflexales bacterium]|nr:hypothetical protein [Chloroflexales bacterium]